MNGADPGYYVLLGKLDGKLDAVLSQTAQLTSRLDEQEKRITAIERWRSWILGAAAAVSFATTQFLSFIH